MIAANNSTARAAVSRIEVIALFAGALLVALAATRASAQESVASGPPSSPGHAITASGHVIAKSASGSDTRAAATLSVGASANPSLAGRQVTLAAVVAGAKPKGIVKFRDNGKRLGDAQVDGGVATLTTRYASVGDHRIVATYGGDDNNGPASSQVTLHVIADPLADADPDPPAAALTLPPATPVPALAGLALALLASLISIAGMLHLRARPIEHGGARPARSSPTREKR